jgi:adenylate kinase family enzyme
VAAQVRFAIFGNSGSGKSTLAHRLSAQSSVEVLDLDTVVWEPEQIAVMRPPESAMKDVRSFCKSRDSWIVEGCYENLIKESLAWEPDLWFMDPGLEACLSNCRSRPWEAHKFGSKAEQDEKLSFLLEWVADYYTRDGDMSLSAHIKLYEEYTGPKRWIKRLPVEPGSQVTR